MSSNDLSPIEDVIRETRIAIQYAFRLIDQQEDGPMTMRAALKVIDQCVDLIDSEAWYLQHATDRSTTMTQVIRDQRDELLVQRASLERFIRDNFPVPEEYIDSPADD
jgi:hypothetical protein